MNIDLHYGRQRVTLQYSGDVGCISTLEPRRSNVDAVRLALAVPIDSPRISELVHPGQKIAIITSDITRPCPSERLLPPIMDELTAAGVRDADWLALK
jgi:nickel-dependent lactate racemase